MSTFISYKFGDDRLLYENVSYALDREGIAYWSSREIAAGESLRHELRTAIQNCSICIFIATPRSLASSWCQAEIGAFWGLGRPVILYLADDALPIDQLPRQFTGDKFATTIREVVESARHHLAHGAGLSSVEAVAQLACNAFGDKLSLALSEGRFLGFGSTLPFGFTPSAAVRSFNAFGRTVGYRMDATGPQAAEELATLIQQLGDLRARRLREISADLDHDFTQVQAQAERIARLLDRVPLGDGTMADPWRLAQEALLPFWSEQHAQLACFRTDELDRLRAFLTEHPAWPALPAPQREAVGALWTTGSLSLQGLADATVAKLAQDFKHLLNAT